MDIDEAKVIVKDIISQALDDEKPVEDDMPLIGGQSQLDSMKLVEVCLALEDKADELGFAFDWTSESAMSRSRSMFRSATSLAEEFSRQSGA